MHELFTTVLSKRDLSRAGELFSVADYEIVNDLEDVLEEISRIISLEDYLQNCNDQSVIEICINRVTSCIKKTNTIEQHCLGLVRLLEICLNYNLQPSNNNKEDKPHAKISSDIISSIFLNYNKKHVMEVTLPVAVQFLNKGNLELSRNLASYLSSAAIEYSYLLSPHVNLILESLLSGNYGLCHVLSQIYESSSVAINDVAADFVDIVPKCENQEQLVILQLLVTVAKRQPSVLVKKIPQLFELVPTVNVSMAVILVLADSKPSELIEYIDTIKNAATINSQTLSLASQILTAIGKLSKDYAQIALDFILEHLPNTDRQSILISDATKLCILYPAIFTDKVTDVIRQSCNNNNQIKQTSSGVTIVNLNSSSPIPSTSKPICIPVSKSPIHKEINYSPVSKTLINNNIVSTTVINTSNGSSTVKTSDVGVTTIQSGVTATTTIVPPTPPHTGYTKRAKLGDSRSTGRLHSGGGANKSMTRLNVGSVGGLHKSIASLVMVPSHRLSSSQLISQNGGGRRDSGSGGSTSNNNVVNSNSSGNVAIAFAANNNSISSNSQQNFTEFTVSSSRFRKELFGNEQTAVDSGRNCLEMSTEKCGALQFNAPVPPPLSQHVMITGENKWGIPLTKITSGCVTVTTSHSRGPRPFSQGPSTLLGSGVLGKNSSLGGLNQSTGSIGIQNAVSVHQSDFHTTTSPTMFNNRQMSPQPSQPVVLNSLIINNEGESVKLRIEPAKSSKQPDKTSTAARRRDNKSLTLLNASSAVNQRMSVFEPYPMRDTIQHFCEKHLDKIKAYTQSVSQRLPPPAKCTIEERRAKKMVKLHFACQVRGPHCLYSKTMFTMRTRNPRTWIHLMFLDLQARAPQNALSSWDHSVSSLKHCWDTLKCENRTFITLVTCSFPNMKEQDALVNELRHSGFFDVFELGAATSEQASSDEDLQLQWGCFLCNHPEKAIGFLHGNNQPIVEGQLKEKKGKWRLFRRWRTRYFTLSGAHLSYKGSVTESGETIDVNQIRSVKVSRGARNIPKAFEIFTGDQTLILKPKDGKNAEEWVQCLSIVVAHSQARDSPTIKTNSLPYSNRKRQT